jgi:hypothetical protein
MLRERGAFNDFSSSGEGDKAAYSNILDSSSNASSDEYSIKKAPLRYGLSRSKLKPEVRTKA